MHFIDWAVIGIYSLVSLWLGIALTEKASKGIESYFASGRSLGWLLAGTSIAATTFSSDTPLLITGIIRRRGIWGNWEILTLALSTMFAVFFFSKLWKRAGVLTEVQFVETRYSGKPAAFLRGFKALYWGLFYNCFIMGAWPVTGLVKVMQETTGWDKLTAVIFCLGLTTVYSCLSGFWGVVLTDLFQFAIAMGGAFLLAVYAINAAGGLGAITAALEPTGKLDFFPPMTGDTFLASPFAWFIGMLLFQWWSWKNTDGGGIIVQRIASCKNEKQAVFAMLWFNIAQYALRAWPWILTALASLILLPDLQDHEKAYPRLVATLLPTGLKGLMVASFFAAFMSTMSTHLNWGSSYFINDFYKRFLVRNADEKHYIKAARFAGVVLALIAGAVAMLTESIGAVFTFILNLTAAIGPVFFLRWFWWRVNPWSEIAAMAVSVPAIMFRTQILQALGIPKTDITGLVFMIVASALVWVPVTLLTKPVDEKTLKDFCLKVQPPGFWRDWNRNQPSWRMDIVLWAVSTIALICLALGPLALCLGKPLEGTIACAVSGVLWVWVGLNFGKTRTEV